MDEPTEGMGPDAALEVAIGTLYMAIDGKVETHPERMRKAAVALAVLRSQTRRAALSPTAPTCSFCEGSGEPCACNDGGEVMYTKREVEALCRIAVAAATKSDALSPTARTDRVWDVHYGNYSPTEVDSVWATEELAMAEANRLNERARTKGGSGMWEVGYFYVRDTVLGSASTEEGT